MRVCLICEGCYPYIPGGVSSWVQMLCTQFSDVEFVIWSIATNREEMSEVRYKMPENIKELRTFYLGEVALNKKYRRVQMTAEDHQVLKALMAGKPEEIDWKRTLEFVKQYRTRLEDILMGEDFYQICLEEYDRRKSKKVFFQFLWNFRNMYFPLMNILSDEIPQADVYHSLSTGYAGILGSCVSYATQRPFLLTEHGIYTREREEDIIRAQWLKEDFKEIWIDFFKKMSLIAYQQATVVTSLFQVNKTLQLELGCPEEKIRIIPNGVSVETFGELAAKRTGDPARFNIGAVLRVVPIKDVKTMILAFADVKDRVPAARLYIMGNCGENPEYYQECKELVQALDVQDVSFLGQVNVMEHLADMDLLLLSSISEGQPLAILEGMAAGLPFVATNVGDCRGLLEGENGEDPAGLIVPVMDSAAMADAIVYFYTHPKERLKMGQAGRRRVCERYRKEFFLKEYRALYNQLGEEQHGGNRV